MATAVTPSVSKAQSKTPRFWRGAARRLQETASASSPEIIHLKRHVGRVPSAQPQLADLVSRVRGCLTALDRYCRYSGIFALHLSSFLVCA
jgi:hypothetical protein